MNCCLASWAVLRWLEGQEPAATRVEEALDDRPVISLVNVAEVFYVVRRADGDPTAVTVVDSLRARTTFDPVDEHRAVVAARIKSDYPMALADAFALATALGHGATLLTGDPEILDAGGGWDLEDLR